MQILLCSVFYEHIERRKALHLVCFTVLVDLFDPIRPLSKMMILL